MQPTTENPSMTDMEEIEALRWHLAHAMAHSKECDCTPEHNVDEFIKDWMSR